MGTCNGRDIELELAVVTRLQQLHLGGAARTLPGRGYAGPSKATGGGAPGAAERFLGKTDNYIDPACGTGTARTE